MRESDPMAEEVRFFLRTALYSAVIAVSYWFASFEPDGVPTDYDWAGTTLLAFTVLACGGMRKAGSRRSMSESASKCTEPRYPWLNQPQTPMTTSTAPGTVSHGP